MPALPIQFLVKAMGAGVALSVAGPAAASLQEATSGISEVFANSIGNRINGIPKGGARVGNLTVSLQPDQLVTLIYSAGGADKIVITAPIPQNFTLDVQSNWTPKYMMGAGDLLQKYTGSSAANKITEITGLSGTVHKWTTGQYWEGPSPVRCNLPFEFIAESNPSQEVIDPIKYLYKMASPANVGDVLIPPGPSITGSTLLKGLNISIRVGNIVYFDNVVIDGINCEIDTRLSITGHKLLHAKVDVSFISFFAVDHKDIDKMFDVPGFNAYLGGKAS